MSADDILSRAQPPADARIAYGSDPNQFGELRLPKRQLPVSSLQSPVSQDQGQKQQQDSRQQKAESVEPKADSRPPTAPLHPVVMNIHGGFWRAKYDLLHASHLCAALARAGAATWNLEYRRVGNPGGAWPGTFEDITNGYRFLRQIAGKYHLDIKRVVVMGHSAGGHLAVALAGHLHGQGASHEPDLRGVVSLAGVLDLKRAWELHLSNDAVVEFLGGTPAQMPDHYREADPMELKVKARQHLIHGTDDDIVPVDISRKYAQMKASRGEQVTLTELPKTGHFEVIDPETAAWKAVEKAVMGLLGG